MRKFLIAIVILFYTLIASGCWGQRIFEDTGFILNYGIESSEEKDMLITATYPFIGPGAENQIEFLSAQANTIREAREEMRLMASRPVATGKIQQVLFSEEFAKKGIHEIIDVFERDPENTVLAWIVIVEGSPNKLLSELSKLKNKPRPAFYLNQLLESSAKNSTMPECRVYSYDIKYFAQGIDPIAPIIKPDPNGAKITGAALFSGDKMVGQIDTDQCKLVALIKNESKGKIQYLINSPFEEVDESIGKKDIIISINKAKSKVNINIEKEIPIVKISLNLTGVLEDYKWDGVGDENEQKKIERAVEDRIKVDTLVLLNHMQSVECDAIGIGDLIRAHHYSLWKANDWNTMYGKVIFQVEVKYEIKNYGLIT